MPVEEIPENEFMHQKRFSAKQVGNVMVFSQGYFLIAISLRNDNNALCCRF